MTTASGAAPEFSQLRFASLGCVVTNVQPRNARTEKLAKLFWCQALPSQETMAEQQAPRFVGRRLGSQLSRPWRLPRWRPCQTTPSGQPAHPRDQECAVTY